MIAKNRLLGPWLLILSTLACQIGGVRITEPPPPLTPAPTPALSALFPGRPWTPGEAPLGQEMTVLGEGGEGLVAALAFTPDGREVVAVLAKVGSPHRGLVEGELRRWRVGDGVLLGRVEVGSLGLATVALDGGARWLAVGGGGVGPALEAGYAASFTGVRLWDVRRGEQRFEVATGPYSEVATGVALSRDGRWLATAEGSNWDVWSTATGKIASLGAVIMGEGASDITTMAFGPSGIWLALATEKGRVWMEEWTKKASRGMWTVESGGEIGAPLAMAVGPARRRLAVVTTEGLFVWDLQAWVNDERIRQPLPSTPLAGLAFSPDGALLAVGTAGRWQVWAVERREKVLEGREGSYAVAFSPDGRLPAWGDLEGRVHLWGIPLSGE